nr:hypothetical protein GCM10010200_025890 [Actinomadura rugatobispora]
MPNTVTWVSDICDTGPPPAAAWSVPVTVRLRSRTLTVTQLGAELIE